MMVHITIEGCKTVPKTVDQVVDEILDDMLEKEKVTVKYTTEVVELSGCLHRKSVFRYFCGALGIDLKTLVTITKSRIIITLSLLRSGKVIAQCVCIAIDPIIAAFGVFHFTLF